MILQVIPAACLFAGLYIFPETSRYVAMCGRLEDTKRILLQLRGIREDHPYFVEEYEELVTKVYADQEAERGMKAFKTLYEASQTDESIRKRLVFVMIIQTLFIMSGKAPSTALARAEMIRRLILHLWFLDENSDGPNTGGNSITYYAPTVLKSMGLTSQQILLFTALYGCVKVVSVLIYAIFLADRFGRRPLLLIGASINVCCLVYLSAYLGLADTSAGPSTASWFAIVSICVFAIGKSRDPSLRKRPLTRHAHRLRLRLGPCLLPHDVRDLPHARARRHRHAGLRLPERAQLPHIALLPQHDSVDARVGPLRALRGLHGRRRGVGVAGVPGVQGPEHGDDGPAVQTAVVGGRAVPREGGRGRRGDGGGGR